MYDPKPFHPLSEGVIHSGYASLSLRLADYPAVTLDGYHGVDFDLIRKRLSVEFERLKVPVNWHDVRQAMRPPAEIDRIVRPFLGGDDPLFGTRCTLSPEALFDPGKLENARMAGNGSLDIIYGPFAALAGWEGALAYYDLPKDEMQYRARAGKIKNLGSGTESSQKSIYKRFYFVDWVLLNSHKESLATKISIIADATCEDELTWMEGDDLRSALTDLSLNVFRVRPWFEPGAWGGTWMMDHIPGLRRDVPNYAWSFEMIVPENGLVLESSSLRLEVSFDWLMYLHAGAVLGECHERFGNDFPIRFDFLDTFDGGNLSVQVHPKESYILEHFGEKFTQQETYYILDAREGAVVNLGFREETDPGQFREALETSARDKVPVDIPTFIQQFPSKRHDLFLIPEGTVHGSGASNLVLEISTTPYIFTFKMYDWLRLDLTGQPRDLNISRAFANLDFDLRGSRVVNELISRPHLLESGDGWEKYHLPTHPRHMYDVWRYHIESSVVIPTGNRCHVLNLVEGEGIQVETVRGTRRSFHYAETFCIPAAAGSYRVENHSAGKSVLVIAFIR